MRRGVFIAGSIALLGTACSKIQPQSRDLRIGILAWHRGMDPYRTPFEDVAELAWIFADGLVGVSRTGAIPRLAQRVPTQQNGDINSAGTEIVYRLRSDARWHDGKPFVAEDVVTAYRRLLASHPSWHNTPPYSHVAAIDALGSTRLRVRLRKPDPSFVRLFFAAYGAMPLPLLRYSGEHLIGTGAFLIRSLSVQGATFERVRKGGPFDRIMLTNYADPVRMALSLRAGEVDMVAPMDRRVARSEHLHIVGRDAGVAYIIANTTGALRNVARRKAVLGAIDTQTIAKRVFLESPTDMILPGVRIDVPSAQHVTGVAPLRIVYGTSPAIEEIALLLADGLQRRGVASTLKGEPLAQYEQTMRSGAFDLAIDVGSYAVPEDVSSQWTCAVMSPGGANYARLCDPALDAALESGNDSQIATRLRDDAALRTIAVYQQYAAVGPRLNMPVPAPFTPWFANLDDWKFNDA